jgi:hypothetical protein
MHVLHNHLMDYTIGMCIRNVGTHLSHYILLYITRAVPWLKRLFADPYCPKRKFDSRSIHVGFLVDKVVFRTSFCPSTSFFFTVSTFHQCSIPIHLFITDAIQPYLMIMLLTARVKHTVRVFAKAGLKDLIQNWHRSVFCLTSNVCHFPLLSWLSGLHYGDKQGDRK